jgi:CO/xanthine dehydrogenase FAD-binding subunit
VFELETYTAVESLDQAHDLLVRDRKNVILGGTLWMRLGKSRFKTGIDLSRLGLDRIVDRGDCIEIGCMTSLRAVETSTLLSERFGALFAQALSPVVGVQFRNLATVGGSLSARFGFSDLIAALLVLEPRVRLFKAGEMTLETFLESPVTRDILVGVTLPAGPVRAAYRSFRKTATDFPVLTAAVSEQAGQWRIVLGARPGRARLAREAARTLPGSPAPGPDAVLATAEAAADEIDFGSDSRGSADFRKNLAKVLVKRGIEALC